MKKNKLIIKSLLALSIVYFSFSACQEDEGLPRNNDKPLVTLENDIITVNEGENATFKLIASKAINDPIQFKIEVVEGSAIDGEDFDMSNFGIPSVYEGEFGYIGSIPAYSQSAEFDIITIIDELPEDTEYVKFKITSVLQAKGFFNEETYLTVYINNTATDDLTMRFSWSGTFQSGGESVDFCDIDLDLELYQGDGSQPILTSYNDCPEQIVLESSMPDGEYYLIASLWTTEGYNEPINIPAIMNFFKAGTTFNNSFDVSEYFPMAAGGYQQGNPDPTTYYVIIKTGTTFTIIDQTETVVAEGRMANTIKNLKKRKSLKK